MFSWRMVSSKIGGLSSGCAISFLLRRDSSSPLDVSRLVSIVILVTVEGDACGIGDDCGELSMILSTEIALMALTCALNCRVGGAFSVALNGSILGGVSTSELDCFSELRAGDGEGEVAACGR